MKVISVMNYKGGVGKTTVTANLAAELAYRGKKILLMDMDAQASLTFSFISPDFWDSDLKDSKTIKNWFDSISEPEKGSVSLSQLIIPTPKIDGYISESGGHVHLISSHLGLINVDLELATLLGGANMDQSKKNYIKIHGKLRSEIQNVAEGHYDAVLIDCPPNFNIVTKNALIASDQILVPAKPDYLSTLGIDYLIRSTNQLFKEFNEYASTDRHTKEISPQYLGVVFTMIQQHSGKPIAAQRQYIAQTKRLDVPVPVMNATFRENKTIFADAPQNGIPVVLNRYSSGTHQNVVNEIEDFVNEFERISGV